MAKPVVTAIPGRPPMFKEGARRSDNKSPTRRRRRKITKNQRARIFERDGNRCVRCGTTADLTIDHDVPLSKGGTYDDDNLVTMCGGCQHWKGDRLL